MKYRMRSRRNPITRERTVTEAAAIDLAIFHAPQIQFLKIACDAVTADLRASRVCARAGHMAVLAVPEPPTLVAPTRCPKMVESAQGASLDAARLS